MGVRSRDRAVFFYTDFTDGTAGWSRHNGDLPLRTGAEGRFLLLYVEM
jgi:hypothetical protein